MEVTTASLVKTLLFGIFMTGVAILIIYVLYRISSSGAEFNLLVFGFFGILLIIASVLAINSIREAFSDPNKADRIREGTSFAFNYFFPEKTFTGKVIGFGFGILMDILIAFVLLFLVGDALIIDAAIIAVPMGYHLSKTYILWNINTVDQAFRFGSAFWSMLVMGAIMAVISKLIVSRVLQ
jgi:hypothetical protein